MTTVTTKKGATPTLLAKRLGIGRGSSGPAEWLDENASGPRQKMSRTAGLALRRLHGLVRHFDEDVPERILNFGRRERQPIALGEPYGGDTSVFSVVAFEGICTSIRGDFPRLVADNRHC